MIVKTLVNNILLENEYIYTYNLIKNDLIINQDDGDKVVQAYGIEIICETKENGQVIESSRDYENYISPNEERVRGLMEFFKVNTLSPVHLVEILDEIIEEYISDFDKVC